MPGSPAAAVSPVGSASPVDAASCPASAPAHPAASRFADSSRKRSISTGNGSTNVEFFSAETSTTVSSSRSCNAAGVSAIRAAAWDSFSEACSSPSAEITRPRRSRSASAWRDIARFIASGSATSLISTRSMCTPQLAAGLSIISSRPSFSASRRESRSSRLLSPIVRRRLDWATCSIAKR